MQAVHDPNQVLLISGEESLADDRTLGSCGVGDEATLYWFITTDPIDEQSAAGRAVLVAEDGIDAVHPRAFQELKAFARPPQGVATTALAAKVLLSMEEVEAGADADGMTFGSSETIALVCWRDQRLQQRRERMVDDEPIPRERLARLQAMVMSDEAYTPQAVAKQSLAAAAVCAYIRAVVRFYTCQSTQAGSRSHDVVTLRSWKQRWQESGKVD